MIGTHRGAIDPKGRINVPARLRDELAGRFFITRSLTSRCLTVYTAAEFDKLREKLTSVEQTKSAVIRRIIFGSSCECEPDKQGRVLIPAELREFAGLAGLETDCRDIVIIGLENTAEIWSRDEYDKMMNAVDMSLVLDTAVELGI